MKSIEPTVTNINRHFVIRYWFEKTPEKTFLIGAGKYETLVGRKKRIRHFNSVFKGQERCYTFQPKKGLRVKFIGK